MEEKKISAIFYLKTKAKLKLQIKKIEKKTAGF